MLHLVILALFSLQCINAIEKEIPAYIKLCSQSDPKLDSCIRKSILSLRDKLNTGIPELDVPSLDPLLVPEVKVSQESGINVQASFTNVEISGATNFRLRSVRSDVKSDKFRMKIWFPELIMKGEYDIRGMLLMMPIKGNGNAYGNFSDLDSVVSMKLKRINIDNKEHYQVDFLQTEFNIGGAKVHLDNLFNGKEEELATTMNQFINENWRMIAAEIRPTLEKVISEVLEDVANKFFSAFPISKLFLS